MGKAAVYKQSDIFLAEENLRDAAEIWAARPDPTSWTLLKQCAISYERITRAERGKAK